MSKFKDLFSVKCPIIGMIHVQALPGTPKNHLTPNQIIEKALSEAHLLKESGIDALMIENMHDVPYLKKDVGPEVTALMSTIGFEVKRQSNLPCGIQILSSANEQALAAAQAGNLDFIRAEGFAYGHLADEGYIDACAGPLLRYRKQIGADHISILTDVKKKHSSHAITSDVSLEDTAKACEFFLSDGIVITGAHTAMPADPDEIRLVREDVNIPIIAGSGVDISNVDQFLPICDGLIVGSHFKMDGHWANDLDGERIERFMGEVNGMR